MMSHEAQDVFVLEKFSLELVLQNGTSYLNGFEELIFKGNLFPN